MHGIVLTIRTICSLRVFLLYQSISNMFLKYTGCPKGKVTILIFNNFLMREVVSMKFSCYLFMILKFCLKATNLCNSLYLDKGYY